jgi:hypothetical protein
VSFENSQGVTFTFGGTIYTATQIAVTRGRAEFDVSSTDLGSGSLRRIRAAKLNEVSIKVDWVGGTIPTVNRTATFLITGTELGATDFSGKPAICTGLSISGNAGDLIRGSATFKLSQD